MGTKIGQRTYRFAEDIYIHSYATVVGRKEYSGPLAAGFDYHFADNLHGETSWEKAEQKMQQYALELALSKGSLDPSVLDFFLGGDLLNQIIATTFTARNLTSPFLGLYGACSTFAEGLFLAACLIDGGFAQYTAVNASSHHDSVERQLRYPTEMGVQRLMTAQWTATAAGSYILGRQTSPFRITQAVPGRVVDMGISDNNDMGSAMAPAAADTIAAYLTDTKDEKLPDLIITGDLGVLGGQICLKLLLNQGWDVKNIYNDCGILLYTTEQDTHSGGSGSGCSAAVLGAYCLPRLEVKQLNKVLLVGTGALLSPASTQQGETIPVLLMVLLSKVGENMFEGLLQAFIVGGLICVIAQLAMELTPFQITPAHILVSYVTIGAVLSAAGLYQPLVDFAGAGATVPLSGFGHLLAQGAIEKVAEDGLIGAFTGGLSSAALGITVAIILGFTTAMLFNPKG